MIGREAGDFCNASCPTEGRADCICDLAPSHDGLHWCIGFRSGVLQVRDHKGHSWPAEPKLERAKEPTLDKIVECPVCGSAFDGAKAKTGKEIIIKEPPPVVKVP